MSKEVKEKEPKKTKVKFLAGNQMGLKAGTTLEVNTAYAKKCFAKEWAEAVKEK